MKRKDKLFCERPYKERLKIQFREKSMLYKFYLWLSKKSGEKKDEPL